MIVSPRYREYHSSQESYGVFYEPETTVDGNKSQTKISPVLLLNQKVNVRRLTQESGVWNVVENRSIVVVCLVAIHVLISHF